jgi:hypothetical protein
MGSLSSYAARNGMVLVAMKGLCLHGATPPCWRTPSRWSLLVPYTIWSHGRLVGETDLGFILREGNHRTGHFFPTAFGESLVPIINEPRRLIKALGEVARDARSGDDPARIALDSAFEIAAERERALELELRDEKGVVIPTEDVSIRDMDLTLELYPGDEEELDRVMIAPEDQAELDREMAEMRAWAQDSRRELELLGLRDVVDENAPFPRFQAQVFLVHEWSIP